MNDPEVIVVGTGPTGLTLAAELALAGVSCRVLEKRAEESNLTRAFGVHARTLEQLDMRGLADALVPRGLKVEEVRPNIRGGLAAGPVSLSLRHPESRFPYVLIVPQAGTEALLEEHVRELGVEIVRGSAVTDVRNDGDGVAVTVDNADGIRTERASYLVACDGAHSRVRQQLGVGFTGATYDTKLLLADVRLTDSDDTAVRTFVNRDGLVLMPPFGDGWTRAVIWDRRKQDIPLEEPVTAEDMAESLQRIAGRDLGVRKMRWSTRFLSERRQADAYRKGRVFLAGDAAHVNSPLGAMGMNTGIQDGMNLGWKIAAAVHGWASPGLLDSYQAERHPVGAQVLRITDMLLRITMAPAPVRAVRPFMARRALSVPRVSNTMRRRISGLSIAYPPREGQRSHSWEGRRAPDAQLDTGRLYEFMRSGKFALVAHGESSGLDAAAEDWGDRVATARLSSGADADWPALTLIRPDGYVAWAGEAPQTGDTGTVRSALAEWCGLGPHTQPL